MMQSNEFAPEVGGSCGARLKQAREAAGLSVEDVAAKLKMPARAIQSLESDDFARIGAPVFVRGQLRSYARLLGVDLEDQLVASPIASTAPSELISHTHTPRYRRVFEQTTRRAVYIVMTAAIAVPIWIATRHPAGNSTVQSLDMAALPAGDAAQAARPAAEPPQRTPVIASIGPSLPQAAPAPASAAKSLTFKFSGDSWVQIVGNDGRKFEEGILGAGQERSYAPGEVANVRLGNTSAVEVLNAGQPVDLTPFSRANVARFTLSSDGSLAPVSE
ncbi:helix-turn-helix domain-containing protein [Lysobacter enzymogenes]|uniref:helix-turn-helix domain-containing protein n=1 Tax=Lysobacter enzymogenes TaxID=69 RepID=UPI001A97635D|nr:RodZ domain-containing protein [Lysobacter enzymogenes]QQP97488.1 helix-turn-helix domain-containing protein [Lysobacter enzymogenes]